MGEVDSKSDLMKDKEKASEKIESTLVVIKETLNEVKDPIEVKDSIEINDNKEMPLEGLREPNKEVSRETRIKEALKESLRESIKEKEQKECLRRSDYGNRRFTRSQSRASL